ncbi:hypothetical protein CJ208_02300 [Finegoldia magna]|jgi:hypothetical protein|uniref:Uncharacterized protein n=1 Tax=Finegoldia magna TaxID=1260 RepID=A0A2N6SUH5_FINMA|nr:hypothetical protein [Finegoldia magna]PMC60721.1 hypothetical protein CJ208_02300 [Finegoldia magna]
MEKRISDFKDDVWEDIKRPISEKRSIGNCKRIKRKRIEKADRLDDMRVLGSMCIMILKFFVLLNVLVITSRML